MYCGINCWLHHISFLQLTGCKFYFVKYVPLSYPVTGLKCCVFVVMPFGFYISNDLSLAAADVFLWRDKKTSGGVLSVATAVWVLFELVEYHLLTLVCHVLIFGLAILFLWSNASTFIKK